MSWLLLRLVISMHGLNIKYDNSHLNVSVSAKSFRRKMPYRFKELLGYLNRKMNLCCIFVFPYNIFTLLLRRIIKVWSHSVFEVFLNAWSYIRATEERKSLEEEMQKKHKMLFRHETK